MNARQLQLAGLSLLALYLLLVMVAFGTSTLGSIALAINIAAILALHLAPERAHVALALGLGTHAAMRTYFVIGGRWRWPLHLFDTIAIVLAAALIAAALAAYRRSRAYAPALAIAAACIGAIWIRELYLWRGPAAAHYAAMLAGLALLTTAAWRGATAPTYVD